MKKCFVKVKLRDTKSEEGKKQQSLWIRVLVCGRTCSSSGVFKMGNFSKVIGRAMIVCENSGHSVSDDFPEVRKIVEASVTSKPKL